MVDFPWHDNEKRFRAGPRITGVLLQRARGLVLAFLLALGVSFALAETAKDKCDNVVGRLAVKLKLDSHYSGCRCMKPSMDFSDPCNSMYGL
jgi:hypothetical protein